MEVKTYKNPLRLVLLLLLIGVAVAIHQFKVPLIFSSMARLVPDPNFLAKSNSIVVLFQNGGMFFASMFFGKLALAFGGTFGKARLFLLALSGLAAILILFINYNKSDLAV